jgi:SulP family sulfate permease
VGAPQSALRRYVPILAWLPGYQKGWLRGDIIGALTAWAMVIPESVAYAEIAGVPPQNAFYAAPIALIAYAILGSSRSLVVGATSAASILSASTVAAITADPKQRIELSAALALIAGVILIVAGLARLGFITNFLAEPALQGFLFGMALIIVIRQLGKLAGVSTGEGDFFARAWHLLSQADDWSLTTIAVGVAAIAALLAIERFVPRLPASLAVLVAGIALSYPLHLEKHGVDVVGKIPAAVPALHIPDISLHQAAELMGGAFGLSLVVFAESFSIANRFAQLHRTEVHPDQEMIGMGAANASVGLFAGFAVSGSASRTAAAEGGGGRTQMLSIIAAGLVLVTAAFLTPLFTQLPEPVLGAIVIVAVRSFMRIAPLRRYWRLDRPSFAIAAAALLGVLTFDLLPGLVIAVVLSLSLFVAGASQIEAAVLGRAPDGSYRDVGAGAGAQEVPGTLIVRPGGQLFFGNIDRVRKAVLELLDRPSTEPVTSVCLVLTATFHLGLPVQDTLTELNQQLQTTGRELWLVGMQSRVLKSFEHSELYRTVGADHVVHNLDHAVHPAGKPEDPSGQAR